ncbi:hypothetical protein [Caldibacillus debilis]|uniref:Uncharacterized protein n=1 Tax=Caldibacillus debilis GB1 TaxID=1339248 RepID=A0A420VDL2_9BACI|nr:hypothetical protein [Caldibacillus debilis]RKO61741.1 hypothetical protein Cdeb_01212 [Caldibacillus debilis GB1]
MKKRIRPKEIHFWEFSKYECHEKYCGTCSLTLPFRLDYRETLGKPDHETDPRYCQELFLAMKMGFALDQFDFRYRPAFPWSKERFIDAIFERAKDPRYGFYLYPEPDLVTKEKMERLADSLWETMRAAILPYLAYEQFDIWERRRLMELAWSHSKYARELRLPAYASSSGQVSDGRHRSCVSQKAGIPYIYVRLI